MHDEQRPPRHHGDCRAAERRHADRTGRRTGPRRSRDACPERPRLPDPDHEAFVQWFVAYWRSNGTQLLVGQPNAKETHEPND